MEMKDMSANYPSKDIVITTADVLITAVTLYILRKWECEDFITSRAVLATSIFKVLIDLVVVLIKIVLLRIDFKVIRWMFYFSRVFSLAILLQVLLWLIVENTTLFQSKRSSCKTKCFLLLIWIVSMAATEFDEQYPENISLVSCIAILVCVGCNG